MKKSYIGKVSGDCQPDEMRFAFHAKRRHVKKLKEIARGSDKKIKRLMYEILEDYLSGRK